MSSQNSVIEEIREQQKKAFATMSPKEKLAYFWDYYKVHTIAAIAVIAFVIAFISSYRSNKPIAFYAVLLNANAMEDNAATAAAWNEGFMEYAGIDPEAWQVNIDTSITLSADGGDQYEVANRQKMAAMMHAGDIHAIVADTETFEGYARLEYFYDLTDTFTGDELAPYADLLYYTDGAAFDAETGDTLEEMEAAQEAVYSQVIDHSDPSFMEKPVAVGIRIPQTGNRLADSGYYDYVFENGYAFQGYPSEIVIGIPLSVENPELTLQFLDYLCGNHA
ncbi:MAG: hypothetical protein K2K90_08100 [Lachnospiraceae bacterium]|nr:hypothetical protein [Lachnospiraceae bacterium]